MGPVGGGPWEEACLGGRGRAGARASRCGMLLQGQERGLYSRWSQVVSCMGRSKTGAWGGGSGRCTESPDIGACGSSEGRRQGLEQEWQGEEGVHLKGMPARRRARHSKPRGPFTVPRACTYQISRTRQAGPWFPFSSEQHRGLFQCRNIALAYEYRKQELPWPLHLIEENIKKN